MKLSEKAEELRQLRLQYLLSPSEAGFKRDTDGITRRTTNVVGHLHGEKTLKPIGAVPLIYQDQNPEDDTTEAQLVRSGEWKEHEIGWLYTIINDRIIWLAKASPCEQVDLCQGWITELGQLIVRRSDAEGQEEEE